MEELKKCMYFCTVGLIILITFLWVCICFCLKSSENTILEAIENQPTYVEQTQPAVEDDILCYDFATGHVYKCFKRDDGNVQLRINPEGNRVIAKLIEHETPTEVVKEE